jgi:hypothetical protein
MSLGGAGCEKAGSQPYAGTENRAPGAIQAVTNIGFMPDSPQAASMAIEEGEQVAK